MMDNYSEQIVKKRVNPAKFTFLILSLHLYLYF